METSIWSCRHKKYIDKHAIVVRIMNKETAEVIVNTYDNFFSKKIKLQNLVLDYNFK